MRQSNWFNLYVCFSLFGQTSNFEKLSFNQNNKITCEKFSTPTTRVNLSRHKKRCSVWLVFCSKCPNFSSKSKSDLIYHVAKKQGAPKRIATFKCKLRYQGFFGFCTLRLLKNILHGFLINTTYFDPDDIINEVDDMNLNEELHSCQHFFVDSDLERARHTSVHENLDKFCNNLKCAAKVNLTFEFLLNKEDSGLR